MQCERAYKGILKNHAKVQTILTKYVPLPFILEIIGLQSEHENSIIKISINWTLKCHKTIRLYFYKHKMPSQYYPMGFETGISAAVKKYSTILNILMHIYVNNYAKLCL